MVSRALVRFHFQSNELNVNWQSSIFFAVHQMGIFCCWYFVTIKNSWNTLNQMFFLDLWISIVGAVAKRGEKIIHWPLLRWRFTIFQTFHDAFRSLFCPCSMHVRVYTYLYVPSCFSKRQVPASELLSLDVAETQLRVDRFSLFSSRSFLSLLSSLCLSPFHGRLHRSITVRPCSDRESSFRSSELSKRRSRSFFVSRSLSLLLFGSSSSRFPPWAAPVLSCCSEACSM